jgi:hypothetical protein
MHAGFEAKPRTTAATTLSSPLSDKQQQLLCCALMCCKLLALLAVQPWRSLGQPRVEIAAVATSVVTGLSGNG